VQLAVRHAGDVAGLAQLRAGLREAMLSSRLCQAPAFVERLEGVYRGLWHRWAVCCVVWPELVMRARIGDAVAAS
jgi:predicted O-linked N-acetylglucosamine transferase (SPINDLY family)